MVVQENICRGESDLTFAPVERDIRIQSGALARLCKEYTFYQSEASKLDQKVRDLKSRGSCTHDVRHMNEVLGESLAMIPQVESQIRAARDKLIEALSQSDLQSHVTLPASTLKLISNAQSKMELAAEILRDDVHGSSTASPPVEEDQSSSDEEEY